MKKVTVKKNVKHKVCLQELSQLNVDDSRDATKLGLNNSENNPISHKIDMLLANKETNFAIVTQGVVYNVLRQKPLLSHRYPKDLVWADSAYELLNPKDKLCIQQSYFSKLYQMCVRVQKKVYSFPSLVFLNLQIQYMKLLNFLVKTYKNVKQKFKN